MEQTSGTIPQAAAAQGQPQPLAPPAETPAAEQPGFGSRGRLRRRARFLRKARELAYRDLGGLVFNLHRFGERNDSLVLAKLATVGHIDSELRSIEAALSQRSPITVLREAGITACPRCAAIHGSEDRFCPNCGLGLAPGAAAPIAGAASSGPAVPVPAAEAPAPAGAPAPASTPVPPSTPVPATPPAGVPPQAGASSPAPATPVAAAAAPTAAEPPSSAPAESSPAPAGGSPGGRAPMPPARAAPAATPAPISPAGPEDSTEILHPQAPKP